MGASQVLILPRKHRKPVIEVIIAIFLPPLAVFLATGCGADFLINILLTILGYIPGIIHALWVILAKSPHATRV